MDRRTQDLQQGIHNGGMGTCAAQVFHQMAEVLAGRGGPELLKGARKLDGLGDVSWQRLAGGGGGDGMEARGGQCVSWIPPWTPDTGHRTTNIRGYLLDNLAKAVLGRNVGQVGAETDEATAAKGRGSAQSCVGLRQRARLDANGRHSGRGPIVRTAVIFVCLEEKVSRPTPTQKEGEAGAGSRDVKSK